MSSTLQTRAQDNTVGPVGQGGTEAGRTVPVVGITGEIGAGKSTVSAMFAELGTVVIDADKTGHQVLCQPEVVLELAGVFGQEIVAIDGAIDRAALGRIVFAKPAQRQRLEAIVHPRMRAIFEERIQHARADACVPLIALDAAILFEAGWNDLCDRTLFVAAPRRHRASRLAQSRGWDDQQLAARQAAQLPTPSKQARCQAFIANDGSLTQCRQSVECLFREWALARTERSESSPADAASKPVNHKGSCCQVRLPCRR